MDLQLNLGVAANIINVISNHQQLHSIVSQLDPKQRNTLEPFYQRIATFSRDAKYLDDKSFRIWNNINLHVIEQMWGSTSGGWGGIGGAAMTSDYTIIITNRSLDAIFVYYGSRLVYIAEWNSKVDLHASQNFRLLPGLDNCQKNLDIIYKLKH